MPNTEPIQVVRDTAVATVTLNNPDKRNALNSAMWCRLGEVMTALDGESDLRCVVVRGGGEQAFAAGADISEFATVRATREQARRYDQQLSQSLAALRGCRHPTVARIQGPCMGGGLQIALACDIRIAGASARFGAPIKSLGLAMPSAEVAGLMEICSPALMLEILLEGRLLDAEEAYTKGLVSRVVDDAALDDEVAASVRRIAEGAPLVARWHKALVRRRAEAATVSDDEREAGYFYFDSADFQEGLRAYGERRRPLFQGR